MASLIVVVEKHVGDYQVEREECWKTKRKNREKDLGFHEVNFNFTGIKERKRVKERGNLVIFWRQWYSNRIKHWQWGQRKYWHQK